MKFIDSHIHIYGAIDDQPVDNDLDVGMLNHCSGSDLILPDTRSDFLNIEDGYIIRTDVGYRVFDNSLDPVASSCVTRYGIKGAPQVIFPSFAFLKDNDGVRRIPIAELKLHFHINKLAIKEVSSVIYLGVVHNEFGHQVTESLAMAYALNCTRFSKYTPFFNGVMNHMVMRTFMELLGHDPIAFIDGENYEVFMVRNIVIPKRSLHLFGAYSRNYLATCHSIFSSAIRQSSIEMHPKIYLVRSGNRRKCKQEHIIRNFYESRGFIAFSPELNPIIDQISLVGQATQIAGVYGSQMHLSNFNRGASVTLFSHRRFMPSDPLACAILNSQRLNLILADGRDVNSKSRVISEFSYTNTCSDKDLIDIIDRTIV